MRFAVHHWADLDETARGRLLLRPAMAQDAAVRSKAREIVDAVHSGGDAALRMLTEQLDGARIDDFRVSAAEFEAAAAGLPAVALAAIDRAIDNVKRFHEAQRPAPIRVDTMPGVRCERVAHPLDAVGLYVPAGTAPLPSAAIMLAVPAAIAGCPLRVLCTPPRPDGTADAAVLTAAARSGVTEVFKVGGAQAIAAMAYGTASIPKVCKIFGPGSIWVTAAKTLVSGDPGGAAIDMPAGPSEVLVIADEHASAEFVAADLLSQAEHGPDSQALLVTDSTALAGRVRPEIEKQLVGLSRRSIAVAALDASRAIVVPDIGTAVDVSNLYAPEHLILQARNARELLARVRNAGSVFLGEWTPEAVGDYCSGTNHVLPTYGHARSYSGLGVDQFLRQMTVQELTREDLAALGDTVVELAGLEGLDAHAAAVTRRLGAAP